MNEQKQLTVLVTGASQGIGASIAARFAQEGHRVAICARSLDKLTALSEKIGAFPFSMDVADAKSIDASLDLIEEQLGPIDVLISNAGIAVSAPLSELSTHDWERMLSINLTAGYHLTKRLIPQMKQRGFGRIIFIASNAGLVGYPYTSGYCASKHGTIGLMRSLAAEFAQEDLTINAICPGFVETEMAAGAIENIANRTGRSVAEARHALEKLNPQRRLIQCDEIAYLALSLTHTSARGLHGQAIAVDGGQVQH